MTDPNRERMRDLRVHAVTWRRLKFIADRHPKGMSQQALGRMLLARALSEELDKVRPMTAEELEVHGARRKRR